jgi:energy-coupling factor transport system permease protein
VLDTVPAMVERAGTVRRAAGSGLDTEGTLCGRAAAIVLVGPVAIGRCKVEARSLALEARGFGRPGDRHPLWTPGDTGGQRVARWLLVAGLAIVVAGSITGALPRLP